MKTSQSGIKVITGREGVRLKAYPDSRGIATIGVGHTSSGGPPRVYWGLKITLEQAYSILANDLAPCEKAINDNVKVPLTQNQFDALASFIFNIGIRGFRGSSTLKQLNLHNYSEAAKDMLMWDIPPELIGRRKQEVAQFLNIVEPVT